MIKFLFTLLLLLFPLGQLERIPLPNPQIGLYAHDLVIVALLVCWFGKKILLRERLIVGKVGRVGKGILAFFTVAFISFLLNSFKRIPGEIFIAGLYLLRWISYATLHFVIREMRLVQLFNCSIVQLLVGVGFIAAFFGLGQYIFYPDIRPLTVYEWDPHYYRVVGTFLEPGFAGLIFVLTMILLFLRHWSNKSNRINWLPLAICYLAFALTYSRSAYFAYLIGMGIIAYFKKSWKFFVAVLLIFILTLAVLPRPYGEGVKLERQASVWARFRNWQQAFVIFKKNPVLGVGFNFYRYAARDYGFLDKAGWQYSHAGAGADNSFLFVLATCGIVGLISFLYMIFNIFQKSKILIFATLGAILVHSLFNNSLFYPWIMIWLWILLDSHGV